MRDRLADHGPYIEVDAEDREAIERHLPQAVSIVARATALLDGATIAAAPRLRVIGRSGVGVERIDLASATERGIPVVIAPNAGARAVAEGTLALILHLVKRLGPLTELVRDGRWQLREELPLGDLDGATLGIIGYGRIGRRLAEIASVLGMTILAHDPYIALPEGDPTVTLVDLPTLLGAADVVSLHAPLTEETRHLIGPRALSEVKHGAVLVNCGRGGLLDLDAAYDALRDGRLSGIGLDVFDPEPPEGHALFSHPDVVLTPHVMALTRRARRLLFAEMAGGMADVLAGRRPPSVANPEIYEHLEVNAP
ncbi:MAG TPA: NAD(P)-dependent oxidoreductase [Solirubrobacterales bacterium]|nr:NAD(P)-dependent oxidoreductase [Solirubrobacterales bacterium]